MAFEIDETQKTPRVFMDATKGVFSLTGAIYPESATKFFTPVLNYVEDYLKSPQKETVLNLFVIYANTASFKLLYELVRMFNEANLSGKTKVTVNWIYEEDDEDMYETGEEYKRFFPSIHFNFVEEEA